jgi:hypothetical protein
LVLTWMPKKTWMLFNLCTYGKLLNVISRL